MIYTRAKTPTCGYDTYVGNAWREREAERERVQTVAQNMEKDRN